MKKSPIHPRYESVDACSNEFDYQQDFTQFLEEARKNKCKWTSDTAHLQARDNQLLGGGKKNRKSWKMLLFSWFKTDRKGKTNKQLIDGTLIYDNRRGHVSGPVQGGGGGLNTGRAHRGASGPIAGFFNSTKRAVEYEVPYMCLSQISHTQRCCSYGPVYLVT